MVECLTAKAAGAFCLGGSLVSEISMIRILLCLILSTLSLLGASWPEVAYDEVRAFAWNPAKTKGKLIGPEMSLAPGVIDPKGVQLNDAQVKALLVAEARRRPWLGPFIGSACYEPHNAFIFYAEGKPVAWMEICFTCTGWQMFPPDSEAEPYLPALAEIFEELKLPRGRSGQTLEEFKKSFDKTYPGKSLSVPPQPAGQELK